MSGKEQSMIDKKWGENAVKTYRYLKQLQLDLAHDCNIILKDNSINSDLYKEAVIRSDLICEIVDQVDQILFQGL